MLEKHYKQNLLAESMLLFKVVGSLRSQLDLRETPYILNILSLVPRKLYPRSFTLKTM